MVEIKEIMSREVSIIEEKNY